jgi:hypothetical protein
MAMNPTPRIFPFERLGATGRGAPYLVAVFRQRGTAL